MIRKPGDLPLAVCLSPVGSYRAIGAETPA